MRAPFPSLVRFYATSLYGLSGREAGGRAGIKGAMKALGIVALAVLVAGDFAFLFVTMDLAQYAALEAAGLQSYLVRNALVAAALFVFALGFVTALSTYYMSQAETALLALPVKPRHLLGAKLAMVYLSECAMALLVIGSAVVTYGIKERPPASFYAYGAIAVLAAPLPPLALSYLILVPLMRALRFLRNKNAMMIAGGLLGTAIAVCFNVSMQGAAARLGDRAWLVANVAGPEALPSRLETAYPPARLAWLSMSGGGAAAALASAAGLALGIAAAWGAAALFGPAYAASLLGFEERAPRRLESAGAFIAAAFRRRSPGRALFLREWRLLNREPVYFLNGPFIVVLLPAVLGVTLAARKDAIGVAVAQLSAFMRGSAPMLAAAAFGAFLGSSTSVACTSLSRDAKALPYLKALPIRYGAYLRAKLLHSLAFSAAGAAIGATGLGLALRLDPAGHAGALAIALAFAAFADVAGLWLDLANPKLDWGDPTAAMKRNPNAMICVLGAICLVSALGFGASLLDLGRAGYVALLAGAFGAAAASGAAALPSYARRRLAELEA
jgi:ABC-2 type transport system permease protein